MKKERLFTIALIFSLLLIFVLPCTVFADMGPKASVTVRFSGIGDKLCYATLLSEHSSTGPQSVWDGDEENAYHNGNERYPEALLSRDIWLAFVEYEDIDGYCFLQESAWLVSDTKELQWGYYPPKRFKLLLYFPESDTFAVSDILERYAFDTYYTADMSGVDISSVEYDSKLSSDSRIEAYRSYMWRQELSGLIFRISFTILTEIAVALFFGLREKKQLFFLAAVNIITQIGLNILLNYIDFAAGYTAFMLSYALLELLVFAIEALLYCFLMNRLSVKRRSHWYYIAYALTANLISFSVGVFISNYLPLMF